MAVDVGQIYPAQYAVAGADGQPENAGTITLTVTLPDRTTATPEPDNPEEGQYVANFLMTQEGLYRFTWSTTSPTTSKTDYQQARAFRSIISLEDARNWLNQQDTSRDETIRSVMAAATTATEKIVGTCVIRDFTNEWISGGYKEVLGVLHGPIIDDTSPVSVASVWPGGPSWDNTGASPDIIVNPEAGTLRAADMLGFWWGPWHASYTGGRAVIDDGIIQGCREILFDLWTPQRGAHGDQDYPDMQEATQWEFQLPAGYHPPPRALGWLEPHRRPGFG